MFLLQFQFYFCLRLFFFFFLKCSSQCLPTFISPSYLTFLHSHLLFLSLLFFSPFLSSPLFSFPPSLLFSSHHFSSLLLQLLLTKPSKTARPCKLRSWRVTGTNATKYALHLSTNIPLFCSLISSSLLSSYFTLMLLNFSSQRVTFIHICYSFYRSQCLMRLWDRIKMVNTMLRRARAMFANPFRGRLCGSRVTF